MRQFRMYEVNEEFQTRVKPILELLLNWKKQPRLFSLVICVDVLKFGPNINPEGFVGVVFEFLGN